MVEWLGSRMEKLHCPTTELFDRLYVVIQYCLTMKTATIRDLRNHFPAVAKWIENGEPVTITRKGTAFAVLAAITPPKQPDLDWAGRLSKFPPVGKGLSKTVTEKLWSDLRD